MPDAGPAQSPPDANSDAEMRELGCFRDSAGPNAGSANANLLARAIDHGADALQIGIPAAAAGIVRVADHVTERRPLAANLASHCHDNSSPIHTKLNKEDSLAEFWTIRTRFDSWVVTHFGLAWD
jgi:hypothetical protein